MSDKIGGFKKIEDEARILYDMYVATNSLQDATYLNPCPIISKIVVSGKTVTVYYIDNTSITHTGE